MKNIKILFTDNCHPILKHRLQETGFVCDEIFNASKNEILSVLNKYDAVIVRSKLIADREFINCGSRLKCIARLGSGMETIDVEYAQSKGIVCLNSPEGNRDAVAEHAVGMLLCLFNKLNIADVQVRNGLWNREENRGLELKGKTVGIIGFGNMGSAFAQKLQGFDVEILAYDKYKSQYVPTYVTECENLNTLFEKTDILSLHVPLTEETNYMIDTAFLQSFKKNIFLINTSRGKIVYTKDLVSLLQSGEVRGACLDVLEYENMAIDGLEKDFLENLAYLRTADTVLLSPHVAGWTVESKFKLADVLATKIIKIFEKATSF